MSVLSMSILSFLLLVWTFLVSLYFYYRKQFENCDSYMAIRCYKDWMCEDINGKDVPHTVFSTTGIFNKLDSNLVPKYSNLTGCDSIPDPDKSIIDDTIKCKPIFN